MDWLKTIQEYDEKAKFIRENDEMIGAEQEQGKLKVLMVYSRGDNRGKYYFCQIQSNTIRHELSTSYYVLVYNYFQVYERHTITFICAKIAIQKFLRKTFQITGIMLN